ncbi:MAG TPA: alpha-L-rhamnosidase C-terminal domain-containing protein [Candidatus Hydrogenedentes bacterium]|nr:alpha-L-rhamnosidase C-terminal domain-containing protein [Candidatus Hydrogenedentota bacterium]
MNLRSTASSSLRAAGAAPPEAFWLPSWHAFIKTVELGSMAACARALDCTRAQVSRQMAELEAQLGARLLERSTRRLRPTPAGEVFLQHARQALDSVAATHIALGQQGGRPQGVLRISATITFGRIYVAPLLPPLLAAHPLLVCELILTDQLVDLVQDSQLPNGSFGHVAPNVVKDGGAVAWGDAAIICPYLMYRFYGDKRVLEAHYANMARSMQWMVDTSENYIRKDLGFGDWVNLGGGAKDEVICTAYFAYLAGLMAEIASVIGKEDDAAKYRELREHIRDAFIQAFVGQDGRILDSSQTGYALAFTIDLIPEPLRNAAADRFVEEIAKFKWHLATGFIGTPRLLPALALAGREDVAYRLLLNETYPSWLYQVKLGATTMWERWNGWTPEQGFADPGMNSFNHYAFGSVGQFMYEYVAGVRPLEPGFGRFIVAPRPGGGLKHASLRYRSIRGEIASKWEALEGDRLRLTVEVPPNTTAVVSLPPGARNVTMNGTEITGLETEVGSGSWVFEMQYAVPPLMQVSE